MTIRITALLNELLCAINLDSLAKWSSMGGMRNCARVPGVIRVLPTFLRTRTSSQITFSKTGKPLTPLPDLRAPLLAKVYAKRVTDPIPRAKIPLAPCSAHHDHLLRSRDCLRQGVGAVDVTKRHRGHMNRIWEHHAAAGMVKKKAT